MVAKKVGGLDLSVTATGVAHTRADDAACTHLVRPAGKGDSRLTEIRRQVLASMISAELVLIEDVPPVRGHSLAVLGMVHGVVRDGLIEARTPYATVTVGGLKKYATGRGTADKTAMAVAAYRRAGLEFEDDNQCDAWWLWVMARDLTGDPVLELPRTHRVALDKVGQVQRGTALGEIKVEG